MKRILLINPDCGDDGVGLSPSFRKSAAARWSPFQIGVMPLGLATIAALTPKRIEVKIWDEAIDGPVRETILSGGGYDLVGVTGYVNHAGRMNEIGNMLTAARIPSAAGGPGVSSEPEVFREHFDTLFIGEAEYTWPQFIKDRQSGVEQREYRQVGKVNMNDSPMPVWDSVQANSYLLGSVQTTRGCPFDCEFCDVIYIYGRLARHKPVDQVLEEVRCLERLGIERILFSDDNFIGNLRYAKDLARALHALNETFHRPVAFFTNVTLNVARDEELLTLLADANFRGVFIGIESPTIESLVEMNKPQNHTMDMLEALARIHSHGIVVQSGMIIGFDHDDMSVFERHFQFIQQAGIPVPMINLLKAPTGTKLWSRLHREGRVFHNPALHHTSNVEPYTNVIPRRMNMQELLNGYITLLHRVRDWETFEARVRHLVSQFRRQPIVRQRLEFRKVLLLVVMLKKMSREARRTTLRLLWYTLRRAPFLIESMMGAIAYQYQEALRLPQLKKLIEGRVRELNDGFPFPIERRAFSVPDDFKNAYSEIFPELHTRLYQRLHDKSRVEHALVEVTTDFLARWGSVPQFEAQHWASFEELCERTIAQENGGTTGIALGPVGLERLTAGGRWPNVRLKVLANDVLRCAEQDLRAVARTGAIWP